jgi:DNA-binding response OmpR family regulator
VLEAITAEDALTLLFRGSPDLLILDIRLPGISGWDLLDLIAPDARFRTLPVIVMTAHLADVRERRRHFPQVADFILKPMGVQQLIASVDRALAVNTRG